MRDNIENVIALFIAGVLFLMFVLGVYSVLEIILKNGIAAIIGTFFVVFILYWVYNKFYNEEI